LIVSPHSTKYAPTGTLPNMLKKLRFLRKRYLAAKRIQAFDRKADKLFKKSDTSLSNGYLTGKIDDFLELENFSDQMTHSNLRVTPDTQERIYLNWDLPDFVWEAVLGSKTLETTVRNYLGNNARLDDLYIKTVMDGLESASEGWHDDNVGYRLKFFMVFDIDGQPAGTVLIPKERPNLYQVNLKDELSRMFGKLPKENRFEEVRINYSAGDFLLFDTNLPHRGDYSIGTGTRYCIIAEFIDREKGNSLRGKAPCGPGQGKRKIRVPEHLHSHSLIDKDLIRDNMYGFD